MSNEIIIIYNDMHELLEKISEYIISQGELISFQHWSDINIASDKLSYYKSDNIYYLDRMGENSFTYYSQILALNELLEKNSIINSPYAYLNARDKGLSMIALKKANICTPWTKITHKIDANIFAEHPSKFYVAKPILGCCAEDIIIFKDLPPKRVNEIIQRDGSIILQEYIDNPNKFIWRVDIVDSKIVQCNQRYSYDSNSDTSICNGSIGGEIIIHTSESLPKEVAELAMNSVKKLDLDVAGVDIIPDANNKLYVLEVNPEPDITLSHIEFPFAIGELLVNRLQKKRNAFL